MKLYRLKFTLTEPSEGTEDEYLAKVPDLPGCRAWGDTAAQAVENLQSVAVAFMGSCRDHGDVLPPQVAAAAEDVDGRRGFSEVMVAVRGTASSPASCAGSDASWTDEHAAIVFGAEPFDADNSRGVKEATETEKASQMRVATTGLGASASVCIA